jgi:LysR family transcriptional regulator, regulator for bpeEF and oprC
MAIHKLRALEYLVAVVDHGGFAAAARRLDVAAPSVHRLVSALEKDMGTMLLDRAGTPLRPTPDAIAYVERARQLLAELRGLDAGLHDKSGAPSGTVRVAAQSVVLQFVLAELLPRFHVQHPQLRLDLIDAGIERNLLALEADVLLQFGWPPAQQAIVRTLAPTRWLIVAAPSYWARRGVPQHPAELARHPCVLFRTPYGEVLKSWSFQHGTERVEVPVEGWLVGDHRAALDAPVLAGQMVARVNDLTAMAALRDGLLQPVMLDWEGLNAPPLNLLMRKALSRQPRVRAFVDFMAAQLQTMVQHRLPAGLPPVRSSQRPDWFKRRVG